MNVRLRSLGILIMACFVSRLYRPCCTLQRTCTRITARSASASTASATDRVTHTGQVRILLIMFVICLKHELMAVILLVLFWNIWYEMYVVVCVTVLGIWTG